MPYRPKISVDRESGRVTYDSVPPDRTVFFLGREGELFYLVDRNSSAFADVNFFMGTAGTLEQVADIKFTGLMNGNAFDISFSRGGVHWRVYSAPGFSGYTIIAPNGNKEVHGIQVINNPERK